MARPNLMNRGRLLPIMRQIRYHRPVLAELCGRWLEMWDLLAAEKYLVALELVICGDTMAAPFLTLEERATLQHFYNRGRAPKKETT